jgi:hypothetical protein
LSSHTSTSRDWDQDAQDKTFCGLPLSEQAAFVFRIGNQSKAFQCGAALWSAFFVREIRTPRAPVPDPCGKAIAILN